MEDDRKRKPLPRPWGNPPRTVVPLKVPNLTVEASTPPAPPKPAPPPAAAPSPGATARGLGAPPPAPASAAPRAPITPASARTPPGAVPAPSAPPKQTLINTPSIPAPTPAPAPVPHAPAFHVAASDPGTTGDEIARLMKSRAFGHLARVFLRRVAGLHADPDEILPTERAAFAAEDPPIFDPGAQTFLAWRRGVLLAIAALMVPVVIVRILVLLHQSGPGTPDGVIGLQTIPLLADAGFAAVAWAQLRSWTRWGSQHRNLAFAWAIAFAAPFVAYLYPGRNFYDDIYPGEAGLFGGATVMLQLSAILAAKVLALGPGVMRAALRAPETRWLLVPVAAVASLLAYLVLVVPFQLSGSGYFVLAIVAIIATQVLAARGQPWRTIAVAAAIAGLLTIIAFSRLDLGVATVIDLVLTTTANVLAVSLITTDMFVHPDSAATPPA